MPDNPTPEIIDALWVNAQLATMKPDNPYGMIKNGAIAVSEGKLVWVGREKDLPAEIRSAATRTHNARGACITPGLIDCHTHLIYGGSRVREFEFRLLGASYEEISRQGGGIVSTVSATRKADEDRLFNESGRRLSAIISEGVTTVEVKSGYGLDLETELRMLRVAKMLEDAFPVTVCPTYLGAHALPGEYRDRPDEYIDFVCDRVIPAVASQQIAQAVDAFCETIGFSLEQTERIFKTSRDHGLPVKLHAEQLSDQGGAALAARYGALSADHLEYLSEDGAQAMAASGTVAVLLPGAYYFLRETHLPPIEVLRRYGVPMALATDCNPGSSPATSLLLMLNMACTLFRLTPEEALAGVTRFGAAALGLGKVKGTLEIGKDADFVLWDISDPAELAYRFGFNPCRQVVRNGTPIEGDHFEDDTSNT